MFVRFGNTTLERLGGPRRLVCPVIKLGYDPAMVESRLPTSWPFPVPLRTYNPLEFRSEQVVFSIPSPRRTATTTFISNITLSFISNVQVLSEATCKVFNGYWSKRIL